MLSDGTGPRIGDLLQFLNEYNATENQGHIFESRSLLDFQPSQVYTTYKHIMFITAKIYSPPYLHSKLVPYLLAYLNKIHKKRKRKSEFSPNFPSISLQSLHRAQLKNMRFLLTPWKGEVPSSTLQHQSTDGAPPCLSATHKAGWRAGVGHREVGGGRLAHDGGQQF